MRLALLRLAVRPLRIIMGLMLLTFAAGYTEKNIYLPLHHFFLKMRIYWLLPFLLVAGCSVYFEPEFNLSDEVRIYQVVDGDTFRISSGEYVRVIGVNAPDRKEGGYHEATDYLRQFEGKNVLLEEEGENRDKFGRLLRHAFVDNKSLAISLLEEGHAEIYGDYGGKYHEEFLSASG